MLAKTKLAKFKKMFEVKELEIRKSSLLKADEIIDTDGDEIDIVQGTVIQTVEEKLSTRDANALRRICEALKRIEEGSFGICIECEKNIPEKRLLAIPDCTICVDCANEQERQRKHFRSY